jgi:hypothetical protein
MDDRFDHFFISLLVGCYGNENEGNKCAHIVYISLPTGDATFSPIEECPSDLIDSGLGIVLCR